MILFFPPVGLLEANCTHAKIRLPKPHTSMIVMSILVIAWAIRSVVVRPESFGIHLPINGISVFKTTPPLHLQIQASLASHAAYSSHLSSHLSSGNSGIGAGAPKHHGN